MCPKKNFVGKNFNSSVEDFEESFSAKTPEKFEKVLETAFACPEDCFK